MRLTLAGHAGSQDVDLDVADDVRLADLRPYLAAVTGRAELAGAAGRAAVALAVDDVVLSPDQLTGEVPLVPGAVLRVGAGPPDRERAALRGRWHLAVVAGPDAGALVPLDDPVVVGRRPGPSRGSAGRRRVVVLDDTTVSGRQVEVIPGRGAPRARDLRSRNGTVLLRGRRPGRAVRVRRRGRRLAAGDRLVLGASVLEVRSGWPDRPARSRPTPSRGVAASHSPSTWVAPAAGAVVLAAATGNRLLLALAAVGPATALSGTAAGRGAARLREWRAARRRGRPVGRTPDGSAGPALPSAADLRTTLLIGAQAGHGARGVGLAGEAHAPPGRGAGRGADEAGEARGARAGIERDDVAHGSSGPGAAHAGHDRPGLRALAPDGCLAVVGPRGVALAVARLLVCAEATHGSGVGARGATAGPDPGGIDVLPHPDEPREWRWTRWVAPEPGRPAALLVVDAIDADAHSTGSEAQTPVGAQDRLGAIARRRALTSVLLLATDRGHVPPWCRTVLEVTDDRTATLDRPNAPRATLALCGVSAGWADRQARLIHGRAVARGGTATRRAGPPRVVPLAGLPGIPAADPVSILASWGLAAAAEGARGTGATGPARTEGLAAALGTGPDGAPVVVDLVRDGPHGLVAGTTGAGKSALLQTWVLALALTRPPSELAVLLVDYKGGAGFGPCARLPHVVGQVTDLDAALAARALTGLRAELRRRERVLAEWSVPDLAALRACAPAHAPPRLLVVVDEFRALVDDLPGFVPGLLRVAAQGRSLGVHLLLATQRPGGAVGPDLRANLAVRVALRVTDAAESLDVVDVPDAALIPAAAVGRAVLRRGPAPPESLQVAHADAAPAERRPLVRRVGDDVPVLRGTRTRHATPSSSEGRPEAAVAPTQAWVEAACAAALRAGLARPAPPWLPPLPGLLARGDLRTAGVDLARGGQRAAECTRSVDPCALAFALADHPAEQRQEVVRWSAVTGPLVVVGGPASGRTTVLQTLAAEALDRGWQVHSASATDPLALPTHRPEVGSVVGADDPRRLARLVRLLAGAGSSSGAAAPVLSSGPTAMRAAAPQLLLVDGLEGVLDALASVARGRAADGLLDLLRDGRRHGVAVAATASGGLSPSVARPFTDRLVLRLGDPLAESLAGVPTTLIGSARVPGRGVWLPGGPSPVPGDSAATPALCQVAVAGGAEVTEITQIPARGTALRLRPIPPAVSVRDVLESSPTVPSRVDGDHPQVGRTPTSEAASPSTWPVAIGLGGDAAAPVDLPIGVGALVVGPAGSGRSTALATVARALLAAGADITVVARDGPLRELGDAHVPPRTCGHVPGSIAALLDPAWLDAARTVRRPTRDEGHAGPSVLLVDDLDDLEPRSPELSARLVELLIAEPEGPGAPDAVGPRHGGAHAVPRRVVVVASALTASTTVAYRGALGALRALRCGLVLTPGEPGSAEVFGVDLSWEVDTARPHAPGRGVVVRGREVVPVQVAC